MRINASGLVAINSEVVELLKHLKVGDNLKGRVLETLGNSIAIRTSGGQIFTALFQEDARVSKGDFIELVVNSITNGKVFAEIKSETRAPELDTKILEFLRLVNLPVNEKNLESAKLLIKYGLPLKKDALLKILGLQKSIENLINNSEGKVGLLMSGMNIRDEAVDVLNRIVLNWSAKSLAKAYNNEGSPILKKDDVGAILPENAEKIIVKEGVREEAKRLAGRVEAALSSIKGSDTEALVYLISKEMKVNPKNLEMLIKNIENSDGISQFLDKIHQKMIADHSTEYKAIKEAIIKVFLEPRQIEDVKKVSRQLKDVAKLGEKFERYIIKNKIYDPEIVNELSGLKDSLDFIRSINQHTNFLHIPVIINDNVATAKLYVFKEGKRKKPITPEDATIVLVLDLKGLGHLESVIRVKGKNVNLTFRVESRSIGSIIEKNVILLKEALREKGYNLDPIKVIRMKQPFNLLSIEAMMNETGTEKIHFDMRV